MFMRTKNRRDCNHQGIALPLVLACLVVAMMLGAAMIQAVLLQQRRAQLAEQQLQSMWFAESGLERAVQELRKSPEYRGEVWEIPAAALSGEDSGRVTIRVETRDGPSHPWKILVEAIYPDHPQHRVIQQRELLWPGTEQ